ncbi:MAG TPA: hypothetical protein VK428_04200 [Acidimicrobiales bacterium]|nr:hypothetical protein [Acidimicrobiales bacterium]
MKSTIESAVHGLEQIGARVETRELVKMLARHSEEEEALLERYVRAIAEPSPPALTFVVRLIVEDERRHHRLLAEVANSIAWGWIPGRPRLGRTGKPPCGL